MPALADRATLPRPDDPDIIARVCDAVRNGHPIQTAARLAGLGHTTAWHWNRLGTALLEQHPDQDPQELGSHAVFADAVKQAEAEFVERNLGVVNAACTGEKGWLPAMTLLERRRPQDFGRGPRVTVDARQQTVHISLPEGAEHHVLDLLRCRLEAGRPLLPERTTTGPEELSPHTAASD